MDVGFWGVLGGSELELGRGVSRLKVRRKEREGRLQVLIRRSILGRASLARGRGVVEKRQWCCRMGTGKRGFEGADGGAYLHEREKVL